MPPTPLARLRKICLSFPEAREVVAWGEPTFRVKTIFAMYAGPGTHHGKGRASVWVKALATNQQLLLAVDPERFFYPPYTGPSGWIGVYLDKAETDWDELRDLLWDAWRMSAQPKLVTRHPEPPTAAKARTSRAERTSRKNGTKTPTRRS